jgi:hypothetical protein
MVYDPETGVIGLISWNVDKVVDCKKTQVTSCNLKTSFYRHIPEEVDPQTGYVIHEAEESVIVDSMPCVYSEMYGRNEFELGTSIPGIIPEQPIDLKMQLNTSSTNLQLGDYLYVHGIPYYITAINKSQYTINGEYGVIALICERSEKL